MTKAQFQELPTKVLKQAIPQLPHRGIKTMTESAIAYCDSVSGIIAHSIAKTLYCNSESDSIATEKFLFSMMKARATDDVTKAQIETVAQEENRIHELTKSNVIFPHDLQKVRTKTIKTFVVSHNGKRLKIRVRIPIKPQKYTVKSTWGKWLDSLPIIPVSSDFDDIKAEIRCACLELVSVGLIDCFSDVWTWKKYLFSIGVSYVRKMRKSAEQADRYHNATTANDGMAEKEIPIADTKETSNFQFLDTIIEYEKIRDFVISRLDKRTDSKRVEMVMSLRWQGQNNTEIAYALKCDEKQIRRIMEKVFSIMRSADGMKLLSEYA